VCGVINKKPHECGRKLNLSLEYGINLNDDFYPSQLPRSPRISTEKVIIIAREIDFEKQERLFKGEFK
jgi:hypothetical protein